MKTLSLMLILLTTGIYSQNCNGVIFKRDKFTGTIEVNTPIKHPVSFIKQITNGDTAYYAFMARTSTELLLDEAKGVYILFDNGQKVQRPYLEVELTPGASKNLYTIAFRLDNYDISVIRSQKITDTRLAGMDNEISAKEANEMFDAFNCLMLK